MFKGEKDSRGRLELTVTNYNFKLSPSQGMQPGMFLPDEREELVFVPFRDGFKLRGRITSGLFERPQLKLKLVRGKDFSHMITSIKLVSNSK